MGFQQFEERITMTEEGQDVGNSSIQTSLATFDQADRSASQLLKTEQGESPFDSRLRFHDDGLSALLERSKHAVSPTELVLVPVDLHRRVIKHRLADENHPRDAFRLCRPVDVGAELLEATTGEQPGTADRIDRLPLLEQALRNHTTVAERFQVVFGASPIDSVKLVEQARTEVESITGYHPDRIERFRTWCEKRDDPLGADGLDLLRGTVEIERDLRQQTDRVTSKEAVVRWACREILESDGVLWQQRYPTIDRVWLCGVSTISATLVDFLSCLLSTTDVDVHVYVRNTSGVVIRERFPQLLGIEAPGKVVFEDR